MLKYHKWIVDTIHGYMGITKEESEILDHSVDGFAPMQRLRKVSQLGWVQITYPTCTHTRFEHSLGTMHLAGKIASNIGLPDDLVRRARIAALMHDLGHGPFSHDSEEVLHFFKKKSHEDFTEKMISELYELEKYGFDTKEVAMESIGKKKSIVSQILFGKEEHSRLSIDADFLDYVLRDDFNSGLKVSAVDLTLILKSYMLNGDDLVFNPMALLPIMSAINARSHLGLRLYFHKTSDFAESMWIKALYHAVSEGTDLDKLWIMGDYEALSIVGHIPGLPGELVSRLEMRDINKWIVVGRINEYLNSMPIKRAKCEPLSIDDVNKLSKLRKRLDLKNEIESDLARKFKINPGHLILCIPDSPTLDAKKMSSSIFFLQDDKIKKYEDYIPLDSVCETNKIAYSAALTVPKKDRNRVSKLVKSRKIFKEILSTV
jgi:HD superfamily phosphohydrolase